MSEQGLASSVSKMREAGVDEKAIAVFSHLYRQVESGETGMIPETEIDPLTDVPHVPTAEGTGEPTQAQREALATTVVIKLNGGLGTSMGLDAAKTLLPVREGLSFLDIIARQTLALRERFEVRLPLLFMNSFRTHDDTMAALAAYPELAVDGLPLGFLQNQEPKITADTLEPVSWPEDPSLEWCPPGHGDMFTALAGTGLLDDLLERGFRWAMMSNGDNLGAVADPVMAEFVANSGAPFVMEVCRRTPNDRKGGHVAVRREDGRLILRDTAMTRLEDLAQFEDIDLHPWFNTNNLWFDLVALKAALEANDGFLPLPLIRNAKTVDPTRADSPRVLQLEIGCGTAIGLFDGAMAVAVPRDRFLPVKTTNELLLVRSDIFELGEDHQLRATRETLPEVRLDSRFYKTMAEFDKRVAHTPSIVGVDSLRVEGDYTFSPGVILEGDVVLPDTGTAETVQA